MHSVATPGPITSDSPYTSSAFTGNRLSICARIASLHGSAPKIPARRLETSVPAAAAASPRVTAYDGVQVSTSGRRSAINMSCRCVMPPDIGTTVAPMRIPPRWKPTPPVNRPYPYALCTTVPARAPAQPNERATTSAHSSKSARV
jgi:hypothetical protein